MRKFLTALALAMLLPTSFTAFAKEGKEENNKDKHKPIKITVNEWGFAWPPVYRLASMDDALDSNTIDCLSIEGVTIESEL